MLICYGALPCLDRAKATWQQQIGDVAALWVATPALAVGSGNGDSTLLDPDDDLCWLWLTREEGVGLRHHRDWGYYSADDHSQWLTIEVDVDSGSTPGQAPLQQASERIYRQLFAWLATQNAGVTAGQGWQLCRAWHYLPDINAAIAGDAIDLDPSDNEQYRAFNRGRQAAYQDVGASLALLPSACALGLPASPASRKRGQFAFLLTQNPCVSVENPRQTPAKRYPKRYGSSQPLFSRACRVDGDLCSLWISGTASIVGADSQHDGDVLRQAHEAMANLDLVHNTAWPTAWDSPARQQLTLGYLREPQAVAAMARQLAETMAGPWCLLQADICRRELLVEFERLALP